MRRRAEQGTRANAGKNGRRKPDLRPQRSTSGRKAAHPSASPLEEAGRIVPASRDLLSRQAKFDEAVQAIRALAKGHTPDPVEAMIQGNPDSDCERIAFATCVDAPCDARRIFRFDAARGQGLTCVRPLMRPFTCRGPGWEFADQVQIRTTCSKLLSQSWFS